MENFKELDKLAEEGYVRRVVSPCQKLVLYNYTDKCTYDRHWNEYTMNARGTVYELETGKVVAKAFPKFFNFGEFSLEKQNNILQKKDFRAFEKADGSLGIIYYYGGEWRVNTRGSFTSDQAVKATEMLSKYDLNKVEKYQTLLVEIIYPENRIIVDYGDEEKLVLLGAYDVEDDLDLSDCLECCLGPITKMSVVQKYNFDSIDQLIELQSILPASEEGFVALFDNGERVKFKSVEYLKLARILNGCSPLTFWESMDDGFVDQKLLEAIPEEFRDDFGEIAAKLEGQYDAIEFEIDKEFRRIKSEFELDQFKEISLYMNEHNFQHKGAIFNIIRGKDGNDKYVKQLIRPKANVL